MANAPPAWRCSVVSCAPRPSRMIGFVTTTVVFQAGYAQAGNVTVPPMSEASTAVWTSNGEQLAALRARARPRLVPENRARMEISMVTVAPTRWRFRLVVQNYANPWAWGYISRDISFYCLR